MYCCPCVSGGVCQCAREVTLCVCIVRLYDAVSVCVSVFTAIQTFQPVTVYRVCVQTVPPRPSCRRTSWRASSVAWKLHYSPQMSPPPSPSSPTWRRSSGCLRYVCATSSSCVYYVGPVDGDFAPSQVQSVSDRIKAEQHAAAVARAAEEAVQARIAQEKAAAQEKPTKSCPRYPVH